MHTVSLSSLALHGAVLGVHGEGFVMHANFLLKIIVGPAISFASSLLLVPSVSPHDCMAHASSTFLRVTRRLQQMALGLPVLRELAICLWFVLLVC